MNRVIAIHGKVKGTDVAEPSALNVTAVVLDELAFVAENALADWAVPCCRRRLHGSCLARTKMETKTGEMTSFGWQREAFT